eukprot:m.71659 g.71659  ORF g.71659 m.71659 type:complete len:887 (-) comp14199_c0_seq1:225-2885(-)
MHGRHKEALRACLSEAWELAMARVADPELLALLNQKFENLEECVTSGEDWEPVDGQPALKIALLGRVECGQRQLLERFLGWSSEGEAASAAEGGRRKDPMALVSGRKRSSTSFGRRVSTVVPCHGSDRSLVMRMATADPGPQVLLWADAFLFLYDTADPSTLADAVAQFQKAQQYRQLVEIPCVLVGVQSQRARVTEQQVSETLRAMQSGPRHVTVNLHTGCNVHSLFHDVVHAVPTADPRDRIGKIKPPTAAATQTSRRASLASSRAKPAQAEVDPDLGVGRDIPIKQGLLRKRPGNNVSGSISSTKRWVCLTPGFVTYYPSLDAYMSNKPGKSINLLQTTVKVPRRPASKSSSPQPKRTYFTLVRADGHSWQFETKDAAENQEWVGAIEQEILALINRNTTSGAKNRSTAKAKVLSYAVLSKEQITSLRAVPGNETCADCGAPSPDWASLNLATLICIECSGIHRNLGVQTSRIRSLTLDDWCVAHLNIMLELGNDSVNSVWEARFPPHRQKPQPNSAREDKQRFIVDKYTHKAYLAPLRGEKHQLLYAALQRGATLEAVKALVQASKEDLRRPNHADSGRSPLHVACERGNAVLVQLLIWYGADVDAVDVDGQSCLVAAASAGQSECVDVLLASGASDDGFDPQAYVPIRSLAIAEEEEDGDNGSLEAQNQNHLSSPSSRQRFVQSPKRKTASTAALSCSPQAAGNSSPKRASLPTQLEVPSIMGTTARLSLPTQRDAPGQSSDMGTAARRNRDKKRAPPPPGTGGIASPRSGRASPTSPSLRVPSPAGLAAEDRYNPFLNDSASQGSVEPIDPALLDGLFRSSPPPPSPTLHAARSQVSNEAPSPNRSSHSPKSSPGQRRRRSSMSSRQPRRSLEMLPNSLV